MIGLPEVSSNICKYEENSMLKTFSWRKDRSVPKVSIVVPIFKTERYLEKCLNSIVNQTLKEIEIICVDDVSPDKSAAIVEAFQARDSRVKLVRHTENLGLGGARNTGIAAATGEFVMGVDSDDYIGPTMAQELYQEATRSGLDVVECGYSEILETGDVINIYIPDRPPEIVTKDTNIFAVTRFAFWNKIWRRSIFTKHNIWFPDKLYYEDLATTPRLLSRVREIGYIGKSLYNYVQRPTSITNTRSDKHLMDYLRVFDILIDDMMQSGLYAQQRDNFREIVKVNFDFLRMKLSTSPSEHDRNLNHYATLMELGFFSWERRHCVAGGERSKEIMAKRARNPLSLFSSNAAKTSVIAHKPSCLILSAYGEEEAVMRMKIGGIRKACSNDMYFERYESGSASVHADCIIINHLDSIEGKEDELRNYKLKNSESVFMAFVSDFYPRTAHQMKRFHDLVDVYVVPTHEMQGAMGGFTDAEVVVIADPIDFQIGDSLKKTHVNKRLLDVMWFGYSESFEKSMTSLSPVLEWMHSSRIIKYHVVTNVEGFAKRPNMIVSQYNPDSFAMTLPMYDLCVLSHLPTDESTSTYSKSENKAVLSINRGVPVIASRTPSYTRLLENCGLEDYLFLSRKDIQAAIQKLSFPEERNIYLSKSQDYVLQNYSSQRVADQWLALLSKYKTTQTA